MDETSSTSDLAPIYDGLLLLASHFEDGSKYSGSYPEVTLLRDAAFTIGHFENGSFYENRVQERGVAFFTISAIIDWFQLPTEPIRPVASST